MAMRKMIQGATLAIFFSAMTFAACGGTDTQLSPTGKYCDRRCACEKCTPAELASCNDDKSNEASEAAAAGCKSEFNEYLTCVVNDAECTDGLYDDSACFNEETDVRNCINPPPPCASKNDGICDEPAPKGNGKCPTGSDSADCGGGACASTNDGICDEPQGTGKCPAGTDVLDCMGGPCATTNNGICDEPGGTGKCLAGTDTVDCPCDYKNDGTCDEPQGTGFCEPGTDAVDCAGGCATTNDGVCDEPQGTNTCAAGTDTADCSMACVTCGAYLDMGTGTLCPTSATLYQALDNCACNGACSTDCGDNYCFGDPPTSTCLTCLQSGGCATQFNACINDL